MQQNANIVSIFHGITAFRTKVFWSHSFKNHRDNWYKSGYKIIISKFINLGASVTTKLKTNKIQE